ncbi:MAG: Rieske (2Fe-2S) protein [Cytophagales bacterium]|nr:Rieske (2Fe-2S) protein [Armatimonadota bacterium]
MWQPVAEVGEVAPGEPKIVSVNGKEIGIFCEGGRYFAVLNFCPHFGAPICRGKVFGAVTATEPGKLSYDPDRLVLRCPWHRWEFDLETGQALTPIRQRLKTYPVQVGAPEAAADGSNGSNGSGGSDETAMTLYRVRRTGTTLWIQV